MTRNHNHDDDDNDDDDASSMKMIKICDNSTDVVPWSDLNHDVLFLVMMQIGFVDFLSFSGVCKSWRSLALSNRKKFIVSRAPMSISHFKNGNEKECSLEDFEGRKFKTILPRYIDRICIGVTCGYLILFNEKERDLWLVNPITSHELYFDGIPFGYKYPIQCFKAIFVFSRSISKFVLVMFSTCYFKNDIRFCITGERGWTYVYTRFFISDVHVFKGKIYAVHFSNHLSEVSLFPTPKVKLFEIKNIPKSKFGDPVLVSLGENLCVMELFSKHAYKIIMNFSKVEWEWVSVENISDEFALYFSKPKHSAPVLSHLVSQYKRYADGDKGPKRKVFYGDTKCQIFYGDMWITKQSLDFSKLSKVPLSSTFYKNKKKN
ncbi:hypothetical protein LXL04_038758 [Taraxacum kok-saghyz]